ncbi:TonB-dependent receptor family protein [Shewanella fidelis]|uniref:TonB-dependent receptor n=1 Tax=Shewanella fidelis TaxID=173509 RepID=A0AAW8NQY0_9GAMM|nr:TonB-dependent receptor [Shewanella fidelis]MDR8525117.1 TonB-dependent receptor [Shewanella fidelis]MDW4811188.1 TonB-dependent receptor [Shewanella fidelis]MDW4815033.1 TonB-dependent receptor [Shewanella fidelis]MDW4819123.1 TonB-dependent receptor [Shewanella fidelis]MDW4823199.1 TonB-dependent receptor [Shewanella fidelis]
MNNLAIGKKLSLVIAIQLALVSQVSAADKDSNTAADSDKTSVNDSYIEKMQIIGHDARLSKQTGSATLIDELELEQFKFDDINRVLYSVPGVNIREEDGYGLRPNIGFRGATPERSKKINIMEDGVLIGPAPYSAASAYYFPMTSKMTAIEVFKGPAAIKYGPNTVAGSLNMVTRAVPQSSEGLIDVSAGSDGFAKAHGYYGNTIDNFGFLIEGVHMRADGFKELDGGGDTGFEKNDIMAKLRYDLAGDSFDQVFELKLAYADETSDETYLGLTDDDFAANPNRRYVASQLDNMDWQHTQVQFNHFITGDNFDVTTRVYRNDFDRAWYKINGFKQFDNTYESLQEILANPDKNEDTRAFYNILTGSQDSVTEAQKLILGNNDRTYYSQGIQSDLNLQLELFGLEHQFATGVRFHQDQIERNHTTDVYLMQQANLVSDGSDTKASTTDREKTDAWSVYLQDTISISALDITAGVRGEFIDAHYQNRAPGEELNYLNKTTRIWLPSFSAFYTLSDNAGLLFGVHEGFLPTSPKQDPSIDVESSINYELGGRYNDGNFNLELIGFFNDISNLKEGCQFSSCGSDDDTEFNGGEVDILGLELTSGYSISLTDDIDLPMSLSYTYTQSEFKTSFESGFDMWGNVTAGDELPYLPENQLAVNLGLVSDQWDVNMIVRYIGEMKEASGEGVVLSGSTTEALTVVDMSASYNFNQYGLVYVKADNLFDTQEIVSRRPYGARPSKPQQFQVGYQYRF